MRLAGVGLCMVLLARTAVAALDWWKVGPIYQIFPASYMDSDGDGWGDLPGIKSKVDYLADLGIGAVWLSPIYTSPMRDNGYDVANYTEINPRFGNMTDIDEIIKMLHAKGIKILMDFVPNHTSNESAWFTDSIKRANGKTDFYVWENPTGVDARGQPLPPNNWRSIFQGPAWKYVAERGQFYLHQFGDFQPDLNYNNPAVLEAMQDNLRFWLRKGVDGFRVDAVTQIAETHYKRNEPPCCTPDDGSYACLSHIYTTNQPGTHDVLNSFDAVLREPEFTKTGVRAMLVEAYNNITELMTYYGNVSSPFNFLYITNIHQNSNASEFEKYTKDYMDNLPEGKWPNWVVGNHDNSRVGTRMGADLIDTMNIITNLLPGTSITYYGEELGMTDGIIRADQKRDSVGTRDPCRTPMQWNDTLNSGFTSSNHPYLPPNPNYWDFNVNIEKNATQTHLDVYKKVVSLHKNLADSKLNLNTSTFGSWVFAFKRSGILVVTNLNNEEETLSVNDLKLSVSDSVTVKVASGNANMTEGTKFGVSEKMVLTPRSSVVFQYRSGVASLKQLFTPLVMCLSSLLLFM